MARPIKVLEASDVVRAELRRRVKAPTSTQRDRFRAEIILLRLDGLKEADVAARLATSAPTVSTWSSRFEKAGLAGLQDKTGRGRKPSIPAAKLERVVTEVTQPPKNRTRWSVRSMGRHAGISPSSVQRVWSKNQLKPHVTKTFKLSTDPQFEEKFWDVVGLYLNPPVNALVLCCDEKKPMPGAGAHAIRAAAGTETAMHHDARLYAPRHRYVIRGTGGTHRQTHHPHGSLSYAR